MKFATLIATCFFFFATTASGQMNYNPYNSGNSGYNNQQADVKPAANVKTVVHTLTDPATGMETAYVPLPTNWKTTAKGWFGPDNSRIEAKAGGSFSDQQRQLYHIDQVLQQDLFPQLQYLGAQINGVIDLPQIAMNDKMTFAKYWKALPSQDMHQVKGIEVTDTKSGERGLIIVHFTYSRSQYGNFAHYYLNLLTSTPARYEQDKNVAIYALAKMKVSDQSIALHNQKEQQKSQASWAAHNSRMRANQQNFDGWQKAQSDLSSVNDIYFEGWKRRSQIEDRMQEKTVDGIWEQETIRDPYSSNNQEGKVASGYKYYYVNVFGEYFGTNDEFYNPAQDPNMNHIEWRKVESNGGY
ncbi:MAG: hypothetical protein R2828_02520 [Saprospiraceae bacterium]